MRWSVALDTKQRKPSAPPEVLPVAGGGYRFTLILLPNEGEGALARVQGFRVDPDFTSIIPPVSTYGSGRTYNIAIISPQMQEQMLRLLRQEFEHRRAAADRHAQPDK